MLHWMNDYRFSYIWIDVYQLHCIASIGLCCTTIVDIIGWVTVNTYNPPTDFIENLGKRPRYQKSPTQLQKCGSGSYPFKRDISGETASALQVLPTEPCSIELLYWDLLHAKEGWNLGRRHKRNSNKIMEYRYLVRRRFVRDKRILF